jgi:hypothetical protein
MNKRVIAGIVTAGLTLALLSVPVAGADAAASTGTVTVKVVSPNNKPFAPTAQIYVLKAQSDGYATVHYSKGTALRSTWKLPAGQTFYFSASVPGSTAYVGQKMKSLKVVAGHTTLISFVESKGATISGHLVASGAAAHGVVVQLVGATIYQTPRNPVRTDASGSFSFAGLTTGSYYLKFLGKSTSPSYTSEYYLNSTTKAKAKAIVVHQQSVHATNSVVTGLVGDLTP